jgi:hypothetical protein
MRALFSKNFSMRLWRIPSGLRDRSSLLLLGLGLVPPDTTPVIETAPTHGRRFSRLRRAEYGALIHAPPIQSSPETTDSPTSFLPTIDNLPNLPIIPSMADRIIVHIFQSTQTEPEPGAPALVLHPGEELFITIDNAARYEITFDDLVNLSTRKAVIITKANK